LPHWRMGRSSGRNQYEIGTKVRGTILYQNKMMQNNGTLGSLLNYKGYLVSHPKIENMVGTWIGMVKGIIQESKQAPSKVIHIMHTLGSLIMGSRCKQKGKSTTYVLLLLIYTILLPYLCPTVLSCILMEVKTNRGAPSHDIYLSFVPSNEIVRKKLWK
jgi:hypothetical protein